MLLNEGTELDFRKIVLGKETKPNKKLWSYIEVKIKKNYKEPHSYSVLLIQISFTKPA